MAPCTQGKEDLLEPVDVEPRFVDVYRKYAPQVTRWAVRLSGIDGDAEDIVQEVFLVVSRKLVRLPFHTNLASWLFQITRRIVANHRRRLRWRRLWTDSETLGSIKAEGPSPEADLERRRLLELFHRALDQLPARQRTVFVLYELEGLTTSAIADLTQRKLSTVKVQLARARQRFVFAYQKLLRQECREGEELLDFARRVVGDNQAALSRLGRDTT